MTVSVAFTRSQVLLACARSIGQLQSTHKATLIFFLLFPLSLGGAAFSSLGFQVSPDLARFLSLYLFPSCSANVLFEAGSTLSESPPRRQQSPERERERERRSEAVRQRRKGEEKRKERKRGPSMRATKVPTSMQATRGRVMPCGRKALNRATTTTRRTR